MPNDWNDAVIAEFRANAGKVAQFGAQTLLLLHTTGAKTGEPRLAPLAYLGEGDRIFIFAAYGGRPMNPAWYHNLIANPRVRIEIGTEEHEATAVVLTGAERDRVWAAEAALWPGVHEFEKKTTRVIPVVELIRD